MGLSLLLPLLLLLLASLQAGRSEKCSSKFLYEVNQAGKLAATEGDSVQIPFSFCHPWELSSVLSVSISWRWKHFHGEFIYNTTPPFIHKKFKNRLSLNWTEDRRSGFLQISNLRREDKSLYFCRVHLTPRNHSKKEVQSIPGTNLTIIPGTKKTTQGPTSTAVPTTSTNGLSVSGDKRSSGSWPLRTEAMVAVALFSAVLKTAILGVTVYLRWKRSKGLRTNARAQARPGSSLPVAP